MVVARSLTQQRSDWCFPMWPWGVRNEGGPITIRYLLEFSHQFYDMIPLLCCCQHLVAVGHLSEAMPGCNLPLDGGSFFDGMWLLQMHLGC